jgi:hypothetical protein
MAGIRKREYQSSLISQMCGLFIFVVLVGCIHVLAPSSSKVAHASSTTAHSSKPPLSSSSPTSTPSPPTATTSRYITQSDVSTPSRLNTFGCNQAKAFVGGVVYLDFGDTAYQAGVYGTILPGTTVFVNNNTITTLLKQYLSGYATCDTNSSGATLILGIGTTNGGSYMTSVANATSAGKEWGMLVVNIRSWITSQGYNTKERVFGASSMALENNTAAITRAWSDGFDQVYSTYKVYYINYGDATGCPTVDNISSQPCSNGWTQDDVAYVSWVAQAAYPLPQIYDRAGNEALQWQSIEYYQRSNPSLGYPMYLQGDETQYQACLQKGGCQGTNNTPGQGWTQLYNALQSSSVTAQPKVWDSTDFQWDN